MAKPRAVIGAQETTSGTQGDKMPVKETKVKGLRGLVATALDISAKMESGHCLWYRGLHKVEYGLIPKLMRDGRSTDDVYEREKRLITRFRQRSLAYWPSGYPQNNWEHLFAMQHYGVPTRLLDWSENLFVAAYFAARPPDDSSPGSPTIWCLDPIEWNRTTPHLSEYESSTHILTTADDEAENYEPLGKKKTQKTPVAIYGAHNSSRIVAQRGTFMVWGNKADPLETFAAAQKATVHKLVLDCDCRQLSTELGRLGFGETVVFPEMAYLADELTRVEGWRA